MSSQLLYYWTNKRLQRNAPLLFFEEGDFLFFSLAVDVGQHGRDERDKLALHSLSLRVDIPLDPTESSQRSCETTRQELCVHVSIIASINGIAWVVQQCTYPSWWYVFCLAGRHPTCERQPNSGTDSTRGNRSTHCRALPARMRDHLPWCRTPEGRPLPR